MLSALTLDLAALVLAAAAPAQAGDCRTLADPAARLACYDARDAAPASPVAPAASGPSSRPVVAAPSPSFAPAYAQPATSAAEIVKARPQGRVASVSTLRYGYYRILLDDGRAFDTATNTVAPPAVGADIRLRRSAIGTTFLDIQGRDPITVRLARPHP